MARVGAGVGGESIAEITEPVADAGSARLGDGVSGGPRLGRHRRLSLVAISIGVSVVSIGFFAVVFQPLLAGTDDAAIAAMASGDYTGHPNPHLVFVNSIIGWALVGAYRLIPHAPWYTLMLYALQVVTWAIVVLALLHRRVPTAVRVLTIAVAVWLLPYMALGPGFTATSIVGATAGILLFAMAASRRDSLGIAGAICAGVLVGVASLVRLNGSRGVLLAFIPVGIAIAVRAGWRRSLAAAAALLFVMGAGVLANRATYSARDGWADYMHLNAARGTLHSTPRLVPYPGLKKTLAKIGWSRSDYTVFANWVYADPHQYQTKDVEALARAAPHSSWHLTNDEIINGVVDWPYTLLFAATAGLAFLTFALARRRAAIAVTVVAGVWFFAVLVYTEEYYRLPERVLVPMLGSAALLIALLPSFLPPSTPVEPRRDAAAERWRRVSRVGAIGVAVVFGLVGVNHARVLADRAQHSVSLGNQRIAALKKFDPNGVFVIAPSDTLSTELYDPLAAHGLFDARIIGLGWMNQSPAFMNRLSQLGISNFYDRVRTDKHVYVIGDAPRLATFSHYYADHDKLNVHFVDATPPIAGVHVYKAVTEKS
jgi:hypothetical protein